jgi:hypothetical protein
MHKHVIFISIIIRDGRIIGVSIDSTATEDDDLPIRSGDYEKVKSNGYLTSEDAKSKYFKMALHPTNNCHVRLLLLMDPYGVFTSEMIFLEGLFTELTGTLH